MGKRVPAWRHGPAERIARIRASSNCTSVHGEVDTTNAHPGVAKALRSSLDAKEGCRKDRIKRAMRRFPGARTFKDERRKMKKSSILSVAAFSGAAALLLAGCAGSGGGNAERRRWRRRRRRGGSRVRHPPRRGVLAALGELRPQVPPGGTGGRRLRGRHPERPGRRGQVLRRSPTSSSPRAAASCCSSTTRAPPKPWPPRPRPRASR